MCIQSLCNYKTTPAHHNVKVTYLYKTFIISSLSRQNMYKTKITLLHLMYSEEYILFIDRKY